MTEKKKTTATPVSSWKKIDPTLHELPSKNSAMLKKPNIYMLTKQGLVPPAVMKELSGESDGEFIDKQNAMEWLISVTFTDPIVSLVPEEGKLCIDDVEDEDKQYVAEFLGLGAI
jgi:hypothetical protein